MTAHERSGYTAEGIVATRDSIDAITSDDVSHFLVDSGAFKHFTAGLRSVVLSRTTHMPSSG